MSMVHMRTSHQYLLTWQVALRYIFFPYIFVHSVFSRYRRCRCFVAGYFVVCCCCCYFFFIFFSSACYFATRNSVFMCYVRTHIRNAIAIRIAVPKIAQSINIIRIHSEDVEKNSKTLWGRSLHQRINFMLPTRYCVLNKILYRAISNIKLRYFFTMPNHCSEFRYLMVANAP